MSQNECYQRNCHTTCLVHNNLRVTQGHSVTHKTSRTPSRGNANGYTYVRIICRANIVSSKHSIFPNGVINPTVQFVRQHEVLVQYFVSSNVYPWFNLRSYCFRISISCQRGNIGVETVTWTGSDNVRPYNRSTCHAVLCDQL